MHPVDSQQDGGAAGAVPAQQVDDGATPRFPSARHGRSRTVSRAADPYALGGVGGADILAFGSASAQRDEPTVDDRIEHVPDLAKPLARDHPRRERRIAAEVPGNRDRSLGEATVRRRSG